MILDPATGTGTYLLWIFQLVKKRFKGTDGDKASPKLIKQHFGKVSWSEYVRDRLLPRVAGFELWMAPYAIAHLKLGLFLQESGYEFDSNPRIKVFLTNTLDIAAPYQVQYTSIQINPYLARASGKSLYLTESGIAITHRVNLRFYLMKLLHLRQMKRPV
jgi:hypothetical protein